MSGGFETGAPPFLLLLAALFICCMGLGCFARSLHCEFVWVGTPVVGQTCAALDVAN